VKAVNQISISEKLICFHCGEECSDNEIKINEKVFCCNGCKTVYELLDANDLCTYYSIDENPGLTQKNDIKKNFDFATVVKPFTNYWMQTTSALIILLTKTPV